MLNLKELLANNKERTIAYIENNPEERQKLGDGIGKRNFLYDHPSISKPWQNNNDTFGEQKDGVDVYFFEDSHWLFHREYYEKEGILIISFNPWETNGKPPVVLGVIGKPIGKEFVAALDEGIFSDYYDYEYSSGAFYKEYIAQWTWVNSEVSYSTEQKGKRRKDHYKGYIKNPHRVVEAVSLEDLHLHEDQLRAMKESKDAAERRLGRILLDDFAFTFWKILNDQHFLEQSAENYFKGKLKKFAKKKLGRASKQYIKQMANSSKIKEFLVRVKSIQGAEKVMTDYITKKGLAGAVKNRKQFMKLGAKAGSRVGVRLGAEELAIAAAPETAGLSLLIAAGISITKKSAKNEKMMNKFGGTQGVSLIKIYAFKKLMAEDIKRQIKKEYVDNGLKGLMGAPKAIKNNTAKQFRKDLTPQGIMSKYEKWNKPDIK